MTARVTYVFQKLFSPEQFYDTVNELLSDVKGNKLIAPHLRGEDTG